MNILVITPTYKIEGRKDLFRDSEAVHYLCKYLTKENNVYVIDTYLNGFSKIFKYVNPQYIKYLKSGYNYVTDGIKVTLIERQRFFPKQINGFKFEEKRFLKIFKREISNNEFIPNIFVVHMPSMNMFWVNNENIKGKKIAILHNTDLNYLFTNSDEFVKYLNNNYEKVFCRSKKIYEIVKQFDLNNLSNEIISSGVPETEYTYRKEFSNRKRILYVGKLIKRKNLDILINSLHNLENYNWKLTIVGKGKMRNKYYKLVKKYKLENNVDFIEQLDRKDVFNLMQNSDIFCMPSQNETLGLVYLEAMSKGCITIGTQNEGIDGIIVDHKNGFLVEPNEASLSKTLKQIFDMKEEELVKISDEAIKTAKIYTEKNMSKKYFNLIKDGSKL